MTNCILVHLYRTLHILTNNTHNKSNIRTSSNIWIFKQDFYYLLVYAKSIVSTMSNCTLGLTGVFIGLIRIQVSTSKFYTCFLWHNSNPFLPWATLVTQEISNPRLLVWKLFFKWCFHLFNSTQIIARYKYIVNLNN